MTLEKHIVEFYNEYIDYIFYNVAYCQGDTFMTYEQFIEQVKWEVEDIARESFDDVRTVVRTVTKNNNCLLYTSRCV